VGSKASAPDAANVVSSVFTLSPDGTQFSVPVTLAMDFDGAAAPSGKKTVIAVLQGGAWQALADSAVSGNKVTATTTHFSQYAIVWVNGVATVNGGCSAIPFTACGGDPSGLWTFTASCHDEPAGAAKFSNCPGSALTMEFSVNDNSTGMPGGTVNLTPTGAAAYGAFGDYTLGATATFTGDIYVGPSPCSALPAACATEAESYRMRGGATLGDVNGQCLMTNLTTSGVGGSGSGTYNKSTGSSSTNLPYTLKFYATSGTPMHGFFVGLGDEYDYCVQGNTLTLSGANRRFQLTK